jgi:hypothetical protein
MMNKFKLIESNIVNFQFYLLFRKSYRTKNLEVGMMI